MSTMTIIDENEINVQKMLITAEDYQKMGKAGIFENKPKVELIDGEIYTRSPITPDHNGHVDKVSRFFNRKFIDDQALVRTQGSIRTDDLSEPEPDITLLKFDESFYSIKQATAADVILVVEVAVFTLKKDRTIKKKKYATAGIPEYWIVIPQSKKIEVYQDPQDGDYAKKTTYSRKSSWRLERFDIEVKGSDFLIP